MPAKPQWFTHIAEMIDLLSAATIPVIDRASVERLFRVRRRQAIALMHSFGGYRSGNTLLIDRDVLLRTLEDVLQSNALTRESARKARLADYLDELHKSRAGAAVRIPILPNSRRTAAGLPPEITIRSGQFAVEYTDPEGLFRILYEFGQAAATDYDAIAALLLT